MLPAPSASPTVRSEEHTSELQSLRHLVCRLLLEKKHEVERQVGRLVAGRGDRLLLLGKERREHVIGDAIPVLSGPARPADADLDAAEVVGAKGRDQGADPVVAPALPVRRTRTLPSGRSRSSK